MCGIAGICDPNLGPLSAAQPRLRRMLDVLCARGPDGEGTARVAGAQIGMRRLAITDPVHGGQPLWGEGGHVALVLNGEIYNHALLREGLVHRGHRFASASDAEVLVHLYEERGIAALSELSGMYAFALWDGRRGEVLLGRDPLGQKPLLVRPLADGVLFASDLRALVQAIPGPAGMALNPGGLDRYLTYRASVGRPSILAGVERVLAGEVLTVREGAIMRRQMICPPSRPFARSAGERVPQAEAVDRLDAALTRSVQRMADTEATSGILLSGGLDSALVLALLGQDARDLPAYVADWEDAPRAISEWAVARDLARSVGARPTRVPIAAASLMQDLPRLAGLLDEPLADPTALPLFAAVGAAAADGVRVLLTGEGADELFAGYAGYREPLVTSPFGPFVRSGAGQAAERLWRALRLPGSGTLERARTPVAERYLGPGWTFSREERRRLYGARKTGDLGADAVAREAARPYAADRWLDAMRAIDRAVWLTDEALAKVDRVTMSLGVEARVPYLDPEVVALADAMPAAWLVSRRQTKRMLRQVAERYLPPGYGAVKRGFPVPLTRLMHGPWREMARDTLTASDARVAAWLEPTAVAGLFAPTAVRERPYRARQIYAVLMLELWARAVLDPARDRPVLRAGGSVSLVDTCGLGEDLVIAATSSASQPEVGVGVTGIDPAHAGRNQPGECRQVAKRRKPEGEMQAERLAQHAGDDCAEDAESAGQGLQGALHASEPGAGRHRLFQRGGADGEDGAE